MLRYRGHFAWPRIVLPRTFFSRGLCCHRRFFSRGLFYNSLSVRVATILLRLPRAFLRPTFPFSPFSLFSSCHFLPLRATSRPSFSLPLPTSLFPTSPTIPNLPASPSFDLDPEFRTHPRQRFLRHIQQAKASLTSFVLFRYCNNQCSHQQEQLFCCASYLQST